MRKIILASTSPRRKMLLSQIGADFVVELSHYEERLNPRLKPKGQAELLSLEKAKVVAAKYTGQDVVILGVDTVIDYEGETLGKPKTDEEAVRTLRKLSGSMHKVITAITLIDGTTKKSVTKSAETKVYMKKLSQKELQGYIASGEGKDKAGCYGIQEKGAVLIEKIEGDFYTVVGLPLHLLAEELKRFGVSLF